MKIQRRADSPKILSVRPMQEADLEALRQPSQRIGQVKTLRDSHHMVARLFALGMSNYEVADATGYTYARISLFRSDPAMMDKVAHLRKALDERAIELGDNISALARGAITKTLRQLNDKLDDADAADDTLPTRDLISIGSDLMDRFGYGKKAMNVNVNVDFAKNLEAAIARSKKVTAE